MEIDSHNSMDNKAMHRSRLQPRARLVRRMVAGSHCIRLPFSLIHDRLVGPVIANVIQTGLLHEPARASPGRRSTLCAGEYLKRRFTFSLRFLLLLMGIAAVISFCFAPTTAVVEVPSEDLLAGLLYPNDWVDIFETDADLRTVFKSLQVCLLYTSPSPRDATLSRMPSSA